MVKQRVRVAVPPGPVIGEPPGDFLQRPQFPTDGRRGVCIQHEPVGYGQPLALRNDASEDCTIGAAPLIDAWVDRPPVGQRERRVGRERALECGHRFAEFSTRERKFTVEIGAQCRE